MDIAVAHPSQAGRQGVDFYHRLRPLAETYARRRPVERIAVVGNQPLAPSRGRAAAIDSADLVFRVNGFRLDGDDEPTTGQRADVIVLNRGVRPTPWFFAGYPDRLYLMIEPGRMHWENERVPAFWPEDLGFITVPNRDVIIPLNEAIGLDAENKGVWATTGTTMAWIAAELFPDSAMTATGFSFIASPEQTSWQHAYGEASPVGEEHRIAAESALFHHWITSGRVDYLD